jgi:radical SAM-linked protein
VRYVIKFTKGEEIKFISHLDLMRTIQRVIRRSELPIEYSKGFNPHMSLSIAQPLSVGLYSDGEYLDLVLTEALKEEEVIERLNKASTTTIKFLNANSVEIIENVKRLPQAMALLDGARYTIKLKLNSEDKVNEQIIETLNEAKWEIVKKSKKGEKLTDIKPLVKEFKHWIKDGELILNVLIATGSRENLSADLLVTYLKEKIENINKDLFVNIKREEMYILKNNKYVPLYKAI